MLPERCPAYITAERFWAIQKRLEANRASSLGAVRRGPSLLGGLLVCGRCGRRLMVAYTNGGRGVRYSCARAVTDYAEPACQSLSGQRLDEFGSGQVLAVLQPAALELHLAAAADLRQERQRLHQHWQQQLERARYETERAAQQYQAVEPENRLVARELERRWDEALQKQRREEEDYERFRHVQPAEVSPAEQQRIRSLASSIPVLWAAESTTAADRQRIIRFLIERIVVDVQGASERVVVTIHWAGGSNTRHELVRAVQRYDQMADYPKLCARIQDLRAQGASMASVAKHLNDEGFQPPKRTARFNSVIVAGFLAKGGRSGPRPQALKAGGLLRTGEWLLSDLARELNMPAATMHRWRQVGWVHARKLPVPGGHWAIWADRTELRRMERLRQFRRSWLIKSPPPALTTPQCPDD